MVSNYMFSGVCLVTDAPFQPSLVPVKANLTTITVKVVPSANTKSVPENYTLFYGIPKQGLRTHYLPVQVQAVGQNQTLSQLKPDTIYSLFVKARNIAGERDSVAIEIGTNASES